MYALAINRLNAVLKCLDGPAHIVRPGAKPPSNRPESATLIMGIDVGIISFSIKNLDFARIDESLIVEFFLILSSSDIMILRKMRQVNLFSLASNQYSQE